MTDCTLSSMFMFYYPGFTLQPRTLSHLRGLKLKLTLKWTQSVDAAVNAWIENYFSFQTFCQRHSLITRLVKSQ